MHIYLAALARAARVCFWLAMWAPALSPSSGYNIVFRFSEGTKFVVCHVEQHEIVQTTYSHTDVCFTFGGISVPFSLHLDSAICVLNVSRNVRHECHAVCGCKASKRTKVEAGHHLRSFHSLASRLDLGPTHPVRLKRFQGDASGAGDGEFFLASAVNVEQSQPKGRSAPLRLVTSSCE